MANDSGIRGLSTEYGVCTEYNTYPYSFSLSNCVMPTEYT